MAFSAIRDVLLFTSNRRTSDGPPEISKEFLWSVMSRVLQPVLLVVGAEFRVNRMNEAARRLFECEEAGLTDRFRQAFAATPGLTGRIEAALTDQSLVVTDVPVMLPSADGDDFALTITLQSHPGKVPVTFVLVDLVNSSMLEPGRSTNLTTLKDIFARLAIPAWVLRPDNSLDYENPRCVELPAYFKVKMPGLSDSERKQKEAACQMCMENAGDRLATDPCWRLMAKHTRIRGTVIERTFSAGDRSEMRVIMFPLLRGAHGIFVGCLAVPADRLTLAAARELEALPSNIPHTTANARDAERIAIAREVHDSLGQELTVLRLGMRRLQMELASTNQLSAYFAEQFSSLLSQADQLTTSARRIAQELRHDSIKHHGLAPAASDLIHSFQQRIWLQGQLVVAPNWVEPTTELAAQMYRILQEALSNIAKHAKAEQFLVSLEVDGEYSVMTIRDDGIGIPSSILNNSAAAGIGLKSMTERTAAFNGEMTIRSRPDEQGTLIKVRMLDFRRKTEPETTIKQVPLAKNSNNR